MLGRSFPFTIRTIGILIATTALLMLVAKIGTAKAMAYEEQTCNIDADSALGLENYPAAIALHQSFLRSHPDDALAHYHLGFAYGMMGRGSDEIRECRKAVMLGLREWDLFLDLGLAYLEKGDSANAIATLQTSTLLGSQHPDAHFNLALAYEKAERLTDAMREIVTALRLAPADPDMRNTKAIICAESGDLACARDEWTLLLQIAPRYTPARLNLLILTGSAPELHRSSPDTIEIPQSVAVEAWSSHRRMADVATNTSPKGRSSLPQMRTVRQDRLSCPYSLRQ
jgi:Flp pilus assembly protein TadD